MISKTLSRRCSENSCEGFTTQCAAFKMKSEEYAKTYELREIKCELPEKYCND